MVHSPCPGTAYGEASLERAQVRETKKTGSHVQMSENNDQKLMGRSLWWNLEVSLQLTGGNQSFHYTPELLQSVSGHLESPIQEVEHAEEEGMGKEVEVGRNWVVACKETVVSDEWA